MIKEMFTEKDLAYFYGTENYYFNPLFKHFRYTDGVKYVSDNGASWLVTDILGYLGSKKLMSEEFVSIEFIKEGDEGFLTFDNGNGKILGKHKYDYTDFPIPSLKMFACNNVLMLASEY